MPQGSSAVRLTNGLYLLFYVRVEIQRVSPIAVNKARGCAVSLYEAVKDTFASVGIADL